MFGWVAGEEDIDDRGRLERYKNGVRYLDT
jgi:hypothetical protein